MPGVHCFGNRSGLRVGLKKPQRLGLFVDFNPEEMLLAAEDGGDDGDLEAELAAITGVKVKEGRSKPKVKTPLPMDHIEKMAAECMKELNEDEEEEADDDDLEKDTDLLVCRTLLARSFSMSLLFFLICFIIFSETTSLPAVTSELQETIEKRLANYRTAIANAKESGESAKIRRYERGLKTLETMLAAVKKGKKINEEEMPPPVATGKSSSHLSQATGAELENAGDSVSDLPENKAESAAEDEQKTPHEAVQHVESDTRAILLMRQKEYKLAALKAKQQGDLEKAKEYMKAGKKFNVVLEALDSGQPIDLKNMPPSPQGKARLTETLLEIVLESERERRVMQPKTVLEALQQRLEKYKSAAAQAKASGDDRKGRMHERIAKVNGSVARCLHPAKQFKLVLCLHPAKSFELVLCLHPAKSFELVLCLHPAKSFELVLCLHPAKSFELTEPLAQAPVAKKPAQLPGKPTQVVKPITVPSAVAGEESSPEEQLEFLENRKKQYIKAAIKAKKENNLEQAKMYLRTAKSFDVKIEQAKCGKPVDISKLPSPPTDDEGDFIFIHHEDVRLSQKADEVYAQLIKLLKDQYERCLQYSKQFMHLGNVAETTRFEKMAQGCKKDMDILQLARAQGMDPPSHHFEERTFKMIRIFSELNSTEMHLLIVRGINLPAPPGVSPRDLDPFVKFEFQYPSAVSVCPEYNQLFKLNINRNHRGFRRAIRSKGIKFEVFHKGSFFRSDKQVGTAHLKLEKLESECEVREIIEIFDGRKPTGGKLEVKVRLREPLSGQDLQTVTENWLVLEH
uniref:Coiled-coil and C2 domain-containing protein 1B n=1 Tax=Strigops habroptila TaxID=2489341 RepID=A0A672U5A8_STRHB